MRSSNPAALAVAMWIIFLVVCNPSQDGNKLGGRNDAVVFERNLKLKQSLVNPQAIKSRRPCQRNPMSFHSRLLC